MSSCRGSESAVIATNCNAHLFSWTHTKQRNTLRTGERQVGIIIHPYTTTQRALLQVGPTDTQIGWFLR